ncbi:MAG: hypothetical protein ACOY4I_07780 [Bacillota bacterium]
MGGEKQQAKVYQFDPEKRKLKSVNYVSPEKKELMRERKQARKDKNNFFIGVAAVLLIIAVLSVLRLAF